MEKVETIKLILPAASHSAIFLEKIIEAVLTRACDFFESDSDIQWIQKSAVLDLNALACEYSNSTETLEIIIAISYLSQCLMIEIDGKSRQYHLENMIEPRVNLTDNKQFLPQSLGLGLFLVKSLMDEVVYQPKPNDNCWRLTKYLPTTNLVKVDFPELYSIWMEIPATYQHLNILGTCIDTMVSQYEILDNHEVCSHKIQLAVQEVCTNIVDHGYAGRPGHIGVTLSSDTSTGKVCVELQDKAAITFDLAQISPPDFVEPTKSQGLLASSAILFISTTIVNAGNYIFNLILGRWLGPAAFSDLSLIITLMLMVTLVTATFQTVAAKFAAVYSATDDFRRLSGLRQWLGRLSWIVGSVFLILFLGGAPLWNIFFHTESVWPFIILGVGLPIYFAQGVDRGVLQGQTYFGRLALSYQAEMWVRLIISVGLVLAGFSVNGAVAGLTLSFVATWWVARQVRIRFPGSPPFSQTDRGQVIAFAGPVSMALIGQIFINNSDILIVKHFFSAESAGHYAALALIGRIVFFATWSVVTTLFPIVAQKQQRGEAHRHLLGISLGLVTGVSVFIIAITFLMPDLIVQVLFGKAYLAISELLWLYAVATMLYALSNVFINYHLSIGNSRGSMWSMIFGLLQVIGLWFFHTSLREVVIVQIIIMAALFVMLVVWDLWLIWRSKPIAKRMTVA